MKLCDYKLLSEVLLESHDIVRKSNQMLTIPVRNYALHCAVRAFIHIAVALAHAPTAAKKESLLRKLFCNSARSCSQRPKSSSFASRLPAALFCRFFSVPAKEGQTRLSDLLIFFTATSNHSRLSRWIFPLSGGGKSMQRCCGRRPAWRRGRAPARASRAPRGRAGGPRPTRAARPTPRPRMPK